MCIIEMYTTYIQERNIFQECTHVHHISEHFIIYFHICNERK